MASANFLRTKYQRECLVFLAGHLYGVQKLVRALGADCLETFCRRGCLDQATIAKVSSTEILDI